MSNWKNLGLLIGSLNNLYSVYSLGAAMNSLLNEAKYEEDKTPYWLWTGAYCINILLNAYLLLRLIKSDLFAIKVWFHLTAVLFLFRVLRSGKMDIPDIAINIYIFISLILMVVVYVKVKEKSAESFQSRTNHSRNQTTTIPPVDRRHHRNNQHHLEDDTRIQPELQLNLADRLTSASASASVNNQRNTSDCNCTDSSDRDNYSEKEDCCYGNDSTGAGSGECGGGGDDDCAGGGDNDCGDGDWGDGGDD